MTQRFTPDQLQKLVAEVERLQVRQQDELAPEQVSEILQELNLSSELLPEAMVQLQRREALAVQQRRTRWFVGGAIALILCLAGGSWALIQHQQQTLQRVVAQASVVTLQSDDRPISSVNRPSELMYQITLAQAPVGDTLPLRCDWLDPSGAIAQQNQYETKPITTSIWQTRCRFSLKPNANPGTWTVKLLQGDRVLSQAIFEVK